MATVTTNYASAASVTITLASLANSGSRCSAAVDNTTNKYVDALVGGRIVMGNPTSAGAIEVLVYGSYDGTNYTAGVPGTDSTITWATSGDTSVQGFDNLPMLRSMVTTSTDDGENIVWGPCSVAQAFGGVLPPYWGIVIRNLTGATLDATQSGAETEFIGVKWDVA